MFAVLTLERDPLTLADFPGGLLAWVQIVGSVAAIILFFWLIIRLVQGGAPPSRPWLPGVVAGLLIVCYSGFLGLLAFRIPDILAVFSGEEPTPSAFRLGWSQVCFTVGAAAALITICLPFLLNLPQLSGRRIWAIARLSFKEAVRRRVLYVFCVLILVLLFINWFVQSKPEHQLQDYVEIVFSTMTPLLLLSAGLLGAFSIPTDIKQQTIHTVVTKPVERFEIVMGRFLGYTMLISLLLFIMTTLSLFYVLRGVNPAAAEESLKARVPVYGNLEFRKIEAEYTDREESIRTDPENVGREWDYRKHIPGQSEDRPKEPFLYAVWTFDNLPTALAKRDVVRCEFNFDIYRMNKGQENRGVLCSFFFETPGYEKSRSNLQKYQEARRARGAGAEFRPEVDNPVSEEFGYFEIQGKPIADYHTMTIEVPGGLIRNALNQKSGARPGEGLLKVRVRCGSPGQMVGMARYDLYFRADDPKGGTDTLGFVLNFYKAALGLWMTLVLIIALCVFVSTELGGIISFLCVILLFFGGQGREFMQELVTGTSITGPLDSAYRLFTRSGLAGPVEETTVTRLVSGADEGFRFMVRGLMRILPDPERFDYADRVANGFNIGLFQQDLLPSFLLLLGYLFPWALVSFYLIRSREIAGAN